MNPMMMMAMASQKKRTAPTDRITNRPTKAQVAWIKAIEDDSTKEVIHVSEGSPVSLSVEVLDHSLSLTFGGPVLVTVVLDLLANEKSVEVQKTGVQSRRLISWKDHGNREQTNCWSQRYDSQSTIVYWDNIGFFWRDANADKSPIDPTIERVAHLLFNSSTSGSSPGYRGSRVTNAALSKVKIPA